MKKILGIMVLSLAVLFPYVAKADTIKINPLNCSDFESEGEQYATCVVTYDIESDTGVNSLTVTLTEEGGATVTSVDHVDGSQWTFPPAQENSNVWTINLTGPDVSGQGDLFSFTYKKSGHEDCRVAVRLGDTTVTTPDDEDKPTDNKDTGSAVPYIALGTISLIAVGAYLATKNKTKMYKI